jgi:ubiquinone/menaquinone biosynthesis C-methylase UbiE
MEGWHGWDDYAPFYDWENAQTLGRRDVPFWRRLASQDFHGTPAERPHVLELGCGTGRVSWPLVRAGVALVGIDRSAAMLARAVRRRAPSRAVHRLRLVRGDIRHLPFPDATFSMVIAPYGILQSLLRERDLADTLAAVARVMVRGGTFGLELVADLPSWKEYSKRVSLHGRRRGGATITLVESVRQDRRRKLTLFDQEFIERRGGQTRTRQFTLSFRTLTVRQMTRRLESAGFEIRAVLGDYHGGPWDRRAEAWIIIATRAQ